MPIRAHSKRMVLSRRSPADTRLELLRYASVWPNRSKGTTSHSTSNEAARARPLTIAAQAPALTNRKSPSEGRASEETFILCCWVVMLLLLSVCVAVAFCGLAIACWLVAIAVGHRGPRGSERSPKAPPCVPIAHLCFLLPCQVLLTESRLRVLRVKRHHPKGVLGG